MSTKDVDNYYNHLIDLNSYLKGSAFHEVLKLDDLGLLSFHWADCQTTCLLERAEVMNSERGRARLSWLDHNLKKLKEIPTWLRGPMSTLHSNLYDTYDNFLEMPFRHALDAGKDVLISTVGEAGPYLPLMSHRWQDKKVFKDFVSKKILTKNMPLRHFRLRANLQGVVYFQGADIDAFPLTLVQMMSSVCLFRWNSPIIYSKLVEERLASFQINIQDLKEVIVLHRKSKVEFRRKDTFIICQEDYSTISISAAQLKEYIKTTKEFVALMDVLSKHERILGSSTGRAEAC